MQLDYVVGGRLSSFVLQVSWCAFDSMLCNLPCVHCRSCCRCRQAANDVPVWRQILELHVDHRDPKVIQQAVTELADYYSQLAVVRGFNRKMGYDHPAMQHTCSE